MPSGGRKASETYGGLPYELKGATPFPEISKLENRVNALISCVNYGPKAMALLLFHNTNFLYSDQIQSNFFELFKGTDVGSYHHGVPVAYFASTHEPIGMVAQAITLGGEPIGYELTTSGKKLGLLAAALAVDFEEQHGIPLINGFGSPQGETAGGLRTPFIRGIILRLLRDYNGQVLTEDFIADKLKIQPGTISGELAELSKAGWIDYESVHSKSGTTQVAFERGTISRKDLQPTPRNFTVGDLVADIIQSMPSDEAITVTNIVKRLPSPYKDESSMRATVSGLLVDFVDQGYLKRGDFKGAFAKAGQAGQAIFSKARISQLGETVVTSFIDPLFELAVEDPEKIRNLELTLLRIVNPQDFPYYAMFISDLDFPFSQAHKRRLAPKNSAIILDTLLAAQREMSLEELEPLMIGGISRGTIRNYINKLGRDAGFIIHEDIRGGVSYFRLERRI